MGFDRCVWITLDPPATPPPHTHPRPTRHTPPQPTARRVVRSGVGSLRGRVVPSPLCSTPALASGCRLMVAEREATARLTSQALDGLVYIVRLALAALLNDLLNVASNRG